MNIDNQLLLGIVFITAGVAMGLLAYAALLNRQQPGEEELAHDDLQPEADEPPVKEDTANGPAETPVVSRPEATAPTAPQPIAEPEAIVGTEADTVQAEAPGRRPVEPAVDTVVGSQPGETTAAERPTVTVDRDATTNRLMVKVDDRVYRSMELLRESEDWPHVTDLFSDLLAWMIKADEDRQAEEEREAEEQATKAISMVQQIDLILKEKLADRESGLQAVRLMEGVGGSIRVYIGVDSYSIEEVPDDEVKSLIREAVAEWEGRQ